VCGGNSEGPALFSLFPLLFAWMMFPSLIRLLAMRTHTQLHSCSALLGPASVPRGTRPRSGRIRDGHVAQWLGVGAIGWLVHYSTSVVSPSVLSLPLIYPQTSEKRMCSVKAPPPCYHVSLPYIMGSGIKIIRERI
jgi:hypothetical protein